MSCTSRQRALLCHAPLVRDAPGNTFRKRNARHGCCLRCARSRGGPEPAKRPDPWLLSRVPIREGCQLAMPSCSRRRISPTCSADGFHNLPMRRAAASEFPFAYLHYATQHDTTTRGLPVLLCDPFVPQGSDRSGVRQLVPQRRRQANREVLPGPGRVRHFGPHNRIAIVISSPHRQSP